MLFNGRLQKCPLEKEKNLHESKARRRSKREKQNEVKFVLERSKNKESQLLDSHLHKSFILQKQNYNRRSKLFITKQGGQGQSCKRTHRKNNDRKPIEKTSHEAEVSVNQHLISYFMEFYWLVRQSA